METGELVNHRNHRNIDNDGGNQEAADGLDGHRVADQIYPIIAVHQTGVIGVAIDKQCYRDC